MKACQPVDWFVRIGGVLLVVCIQMTAHGQAGSLKGTWINAAMQAVVIKDMTGGSTTNYLSAGDFSRHFSLIQRGDTLDFTNSYTSSADKFRQVHTDHLTFTVTQPNRRMLVLVPVSKFAEEFFGNRRPIVVNRQELTVDSTIRFEKLAFASGPCHGTCPTYEFDLDSTGMFRLHIIDAYKADLSYPIDTTARGYFVGHLPDSLQRQLISALQTCYIRQLTVEPVLCCDAPLQTLTVHVSGQQKMFNTEFPPIVVEKLIGVLHAIYATCPRQRVTTPFVIENPARGMR